MKASGLEADAIYKIWIQPAPVVAGQTLNKTQDPSGAQEVVITAPDGSIPVTLIWQIPSNATLSYAEWDIVLDKQNDGANTGKYNSASDGIDSASVVGFVAPVPELPTIVLLGIGLVGLGAWFGIRRRRKIADFTGVR